MLKTGHRVTLALRHPTQPTPGRLTDSLSGGYVFLLPCRVPAPGSWHRRRYGSGMIRGCGSGYVSSELLFCGLGRCNSRFRWQADSRRKPNCCDRLNSRGTPKPDATSRQGMLGPANTWQLRRRPNPDGCKTSARQLRKTTLRGQAIGTDTCTSLARTRPVRLQPVDTRRLKDCSRTLCFCARAFVLQFLFTRPRAQSFLPGAEKRTCLLWHAVPGGFLLATSSSTGRALQRSPTSQAKRNNSLSQDAAYKGSNSSFKAANLPDRASGDPLSAKGGVVLQSSPLFA